MAKYILLFLCLITSSIALGAGGREGGGGGGVCTDKRCLTLAQAGLRINTARTLGFRLEDEVVKSLMDLIDRLPWEFDRSELKKLAAGGPDTFAVVSESDLEKFEKFKTEYMEILRDTDFQEKVELLAVSSKGKTYLLPGFEKLDSKGKALLLLHEMLIRDFKASVLQALTFDGLLLDFTEGQTTAAKDLIRLLKVLRVIPSAQEFNVRVLNTGAKVEAITVAMQTCLLNSQSDQPCRLKTIERDQRPGGYIFNVKVTDQYENAPRKVFSAVYHFSTGHMNFWEEGERLALTMAKESCRQDCSTSCVKVQSTTAIRSFANREKFPWLAEHLDGLEFTSVVKVACEK